MEIKAALLNGTGQEFKFGTVKLDTQLLPEDILVRVVATGLCYTDLAIRDKQIIYAAGYPRS